MSVSNFKNSILTLLPTFNMYNIFVTTCYRYQTIDEDHLIMYRTVDSKNIIQFASNELNEQPANVQKSEVVEYKQGTLQGSRGTVKITVNGPVQSRKISHQSVDDDSVTYDESFGSNELSGTGKYSLKLEKCMKMASVARRSVNNPELTESKLHATLKTGTSFLDSNTSPLKSVAANP